MHVPVILDSMLYSVVWLCCADVHVVSCSECEQWDDMMMKTNEFCAEKDMHMLLSPTISFRMRYLSTYIHQFNERMTSSVPSTPLIKWLDAQIEISITFEWEYTRVKSSNKIRWFDTAIRYLFVFVFFHFISSLPSPRTQHAQSHHPLLNCFFDYFNIISLSAPWVVFLFLLSIWFGLLRMRRRFSASRRERRKLWIFSYKRRKKRKCCFHDFLR